MLLRQEKLLPLATLFAVDNKSTYYLEKKKGSIFYAQCWALTHYLMLQDYAEKTSKIAQYRMLVDDNVDPVAAAIQVFGDLRKLQRTLELYIAQRSFNHFETKLLNKLDDSQLEVKSITRAQADALQADFLAASERVEEARAFLSSLPTDDASVQANLASLQPARSSQPEDKPVNDVQTDVPCPLTQILSGASERAAEMVENLQRFTATEQVEHTEFRRSGRPRSASNQWFNYTAEIDQGSSGSFWVEEYRSAKTQGDAPPISDTGTAAFALIFHPQKIGNFEFHCEGRADVQGTEAWQLRFEESPDPGRSFHQIRISRSVYQLRFKGRAWIAANGYQILRLLTDLVAPIPQIQLQLEHLDIVYAPVTFDKQQFTMWLPESASMQIGYRGRHYQRVHKFTHFQLFLVVTKQTVKEPSLGPGA